jgi:hypothetical protein
MPYPIWVGVYEANAIALENRKVATPRPMTHDLLKNVLHGLSWSVSKVVVSQLIDDTFYAIIWLEREGRLISIDSRPSDTGLSPAHGFLPFTSRKKSSKSSKAASAGQEKDSSQELKR